MTEPLTAKGVNGTLAFDGSTLTIARKGIGNRGEKRVPVASIAAVQIRPATLLVNGFIQFSIAGEVSRSQGGVGRLQDAANDENAVIFTKGSAAAFDAFRDAVLAAQSAPAAAETPTLAGEVFKLAELRDAGLITADEFEAKKADIIARI